VTLQNGYRVSAVLSGAWRPSAPSLDLVSEELANVAPRLLRSGAGGLAWWRLRGSPLSGSPAGLEFLQAYRLHTLQAALHDREVRLAFAALRDAGVEPVLAKGWAAARLYPESGLRPYGDIDLCVPPQQHDTASRIVARPSSGLSSVDLHPGFAMLDDRSLTDLYTASVVTSLEGVDIRVLGPEDHLRYLSLHMLGHGAWRPLWLCDVAAALECLPSGFDWDNLLRGDRRRTDWVICTLGLAQGLLGARLPDVPRVVRDRPLPWWLATTVLRQWGRGQTPHGSRTPFAQESLRRPGRLLKALWVRWPNGIEATVGLHGPFNQWPRLPFQLGECLRRIARFVRDRARSTKA